MHEAVAKDAKLQIQVPLALVSQEQTPRKKTFLLTLGSEIALG